MPEDREGTEMFHRLMPFTRTLGIRVLRYEPEDVRARLGWSPTLCTAGHVLHGGAIMALGDGTGGACAYLNLPPGAGTTTFETHTNLLRAGRGGYVEASSRPCISVAP
jgi:1,4-dihydroxy-2-naphthoyl-CoA hydrolase